MDWSCSQCTFLNSDSSLVCEICHTPAIPRSADKQKQIFNVDELVMVGGDDADWGEFEQQPDLPTEQKTETHPAEQLDPQKWWDSIKLEDLQFLLRLLCKKAKEKEPQYRIPDTQSVIRFKQCISRMVSSTGIAAGTDWIKDLHSQYLLEKNLSPSL